MSAYLIFYFVVFLFLLILTVKNLTCIEPQNYLLPFYFFIFINIGLFSAIYIDTILEDIPFSFEQSGVFNFFNSILITLSIFTLLTVFLSREEKNIPLFFYHERLVLNMLYALVVISCLTLIINSSLTAYWTKFVTFDLAGSLYWKLRVDNFENSDPILIKLCFVIINAFSNFLLAYYYLKTKETKSGKSKFYFLLALLILFGIFDLHKSFILRPIVTVLFTMTFWKLRHKRINVKSIYAVLGLLGILIFILLPVALRLQYNNFTYEYAIEMAFKRLFNEPNRVLALPFLVYPNIHGFLYGASSRFTALFAFSSSNELMSPYLYIPQVLYGHFKSSFNSTFIGDAWADFGYVGVILYSFFVAFLFFKLFKKIRAVNDQTVRIALCSGAVFPAIHFTGAGIGTSLNFAGFGWFFLLVLLFFRRKNHK